MDLKSILKTAFPFIATAASIGGPLGTMAAGAVGKALEVESIPSTVDGISDALAVATSKDPDAMLKLKQAEEQFQLQMQALGFENIEKLEQIAAADRSDARAREIAVRDKTPRNISYAVVAMVFFIEGYIVIHGITGVNEIVLGRILGTLDLALGLVLGYYFGSSAGSQSKDATIHAAVTGSNR